LVYEYHNMKVVIVGGGIAGVTCANHLLQHLNGEDQHHPDLDVTLVSASDFLKVSPLFLSIPSCVSQLFLLLLLLLVSREDPAHHSQPG